MSDDDFAQRGGLGALLDAHARLLDFDDLAEGVSEVPRVREALRLLVGDGLVTQLADRVGVGRAAVRFEELRQPA